MFTGIVEETGTIAGVDRREDVVAVRIEAKRVLEGLGVGGSIAVESHPEAGAVFRVILPAPPEG